MSVKFYQCRNPREVEEEAERLLMRLNNDVKNMICSGFQKMSQNQNFRNFVQDVIRKIEKSDLPYVTIKQKTEFQSSPSDPDKRVFTYPRQNITVAGISPAKYQLPAYFDFEIDFSIFLYGLLEALTWTGGARVTLAENSVFGNTKSYNSNSDFLQFLANRYRYYIFKKAGCYSDKKEREKCEEKHKYSSGDLHVFYNNVGFFTNGTGATVERSVDPYTTNPRYRGSLITEVTLWEFSHPAEAPDTPQKPGKSEWY